LQSVCTLSVFISDIPLCHMNSRKEVQTITSKYTFDIFLYLCDRASLIQ